MRKTRLNLRSAAMIVACLAVTIAFTSCGGRSSSGGESGSSGSKNLSGTYDGKTNGTIIFSGNKFKIMQDGEVRVEGTYELVEEYKENDFSRGKLILTHREGKEEGNYTLEGKKGEILMINDININNRSHYSYNGIFIKGGKNSKIPDGTYSGEYSETITFSGNNLIDIKEYPYEFIVGYEDKGISKGYILIRTENGEVTYKCVLEKNKLTLDIRNSQGQLLVLTKE